jgi:hypothetical protein
MDDCHFGYKSKFLKRTTLLIETSLCALKPLIKARRLKRERSGNNKGSFDLVDHILRNVDQVLAV